MARTYTYICVRTEHYTIEDLERYWRCWERQKELDSRYVPPPPAEKTRVPGTAFAGTSSRQKAIVAVEKGAEGTSSKSVKPEEKREAKKLAKPTRPAGGKSSDGEQKQPFVQPVTPGLPTERVEASRVNRGEGARLRVRSLENGVLGLRGVVMVPTRRC